jgi:cytochrome c-type biogenesis protein CcmE
MNPKRKKRLFAVLLLVSGVGVAVGLTTYALRQNIDHFYTPSQLSAAAVPLDRRIRIGGLVIVGSLQREPNSLKVAFVVTDYKAQTRIEYEGILPDLFREGQGIIAVGKLNSAGIVVAEEVLAKHDEKYMPPEIKAAIDEAGHPGASH